MNTILPTKKSLELADRHADKMRKVALSKADKDFSGLTRKTVKGEVRYYKTTTRYATVSIRGGYRWFEVRSDGDYPV